MSAIDRIRSQISAATQNGRKVDANTVDQIMLGVQASGGLNPAEQAELLKHVDGFDEGGKVRLQQYLASNAQPGARVNVLANGKLEGIGGRYADLQSAVPGMQAKVGLFDSVFSLSGTATKPGVLTLKMDGKSISVPVKAGDTPDVVLKAVQAKLPSGMSGVVLGGDVQPYDMEAFKGAPPAPGESAHICLYKPAALGLKPGQRPLRVVVTGYGDFMGVMNNPSDAMASKLAQMGMPGAVVEYQRLDVTPEAVTTFVNQMKADPPDVILSMGMAPASQVEEAPENRIGSGVDGAGKPLPEGVIDPQGPPLESSDLPLQAIDWALDSSFGKQRVVGSSHSDPNYQPDRSAYLCNFLGYKLAEAFGGTGTAAGFVHITEQTPAEQMHTLLQAVVANQAEKARPPTAPALVS